MGLAFEFNEGQSCPILACDSCGKKIEDWGLAIVTFERHSDDGEILEIEGVYHKGSCNSKAPLSMELRYYLPWLLFNHKWGKVQKDKQGNETITIKVPKPLPI